MGLLAEFRRKARTIGFVRILIGLLGAALCILRNLGTDAAVWTPIVLGCGLVLPYFLKTPLIRSMPYTMYGMSMLFGMAVVLLMLFGRQPVDALVAEPALHAWLRAVSSGGFGLYVGCFFWMVTDDRIGPCR